MTASPPATPRGELSVAFLTESECRNCGGAGCGKCEGRGIVPACDACFYGDHEWCTEPACECCDGLGEDEEDDAA